MSFSNPQALWLLLLLPLLWWLANHYRRGRSILRFSLQLLVRSIIIIVIILALAGLQRVNISDTLTTMFVLDMSDSVGAVGQATGVDYIRRAMATMEQDDRAGVVVFGADALVERLPGDSPNLGDIASTPIRSYSNLAGAINLAVASFPNETARRIVIISDGKANVGSARQAAQLAATTGVEISAVELPMITGTEARLVALDAPSYLHSGEQFDLKLQVDSTSAMSVPVQIFSKGQLIAQDTLRLQPGSNQFSIPQVAGESGFLTFEARIFPPQDLFLQNNALESFSEVEGPLKILTVTDDLSEARPVVEALKSTDLHVDLIQANTMPSDLRRLGEYDAVILVNVPSFNLAPRQLDLLKTYVRDLGGGLVVIGGEQSYGPGGYFQTSLEEALPVEMTITDKQRLPGMTIMFVIDKSGSMETSGSIAGGPRKVELAKEAIYRSIDLLVPWDRIGVIAFDNAARWVVQPIEVSAPKSIKDKVGTIRASGGTDILAGLQAAAQAMLYETTQVRHIVLLSDGGADPTGIIELTEELADKGVTVSVVAIGDGYAPFLEDVAKIGNGRFHFADDATVIPQIFAQETSLATRSYIVEETFTPKVVSPSPILEGLTRVPALHGYVATSSKLTAQTILIGGPEDDPLLVAWQYGLGRSVAWTSDAKGQWAADWLSWSEFPRFWSQAVRWTMVERGSGGIESQIQQVGDKAIVTAELLDGQGRYLNNLTTTLSLVDPGFEQQTIELKQVAPGLYEGEFRPEAQGTYFLHIAGRKGDKVVAAQTRGYVMAYSPEYRPENLSAASVLQDVAQIGQGQLLPLDQPALAFEHTLAPAEANTDLWPWLLLAAVLLLPLDVGVRRILFGREDLRLLWGKLRNRLPDTPTSRPASSSASQLLKTKRPKQQRFSTTPRQKSTPSTTKKAAWRSKSTQSPSTTPPANSETASSDEETVQRLLRAKRRRRR